VDLTQSSLKSTEKQSLTPPVNHADLMQSIHQQIEITHQYTPFRNSPKNLMACPKQNPNCNSLAAVIILPEIP